MHLSYTSQRGMKVPADLRRYAESLFTLGCLISLQLTGDAHVYLILRC